MMERYKITTSLGLVIISLDPDQYETVTWEKVDKYRCEPTGIHMSEVRNYKFVVESGQEYLKDLYDGWLSHILKTNNGNLFAIIELSDGYYGGAEYLMEKIQ